MRRPERRSRWRRSARVRAARRARAQPHERLAARVHVRPHLGPCRHEGASPRDAARAARSPRRSRCECGERCGSPSSRSPAAMRSSSERTVASSHQASAGARHARTRHAARPARGCGRSRVLRADHAPAPRRSAPVERGDLDPGVSLDRGGQRQPAQHRSRSPREDVLGRHDRGVRTASADERVAASCALTPRNGATSPTDRTRRGVTPASRAALTANGSASKGFGSGVGVRMRTASVLVADAAPPDVRSVRNSPAPAPAEGESLAPARGREDACCRNAFEESDKTRPLGQGKGVVGRGLWEGGCGKGVVGSGLWEWAREVGEGGGRRWVVGGGRRWVRKGGEGRGRRWL